MIEASRFIVQSEERLAWLDARTRGVTATEVALAATPAGFKTAVERRILGSDLRVTAAMEWGSEREASIARAVKETHGVFPNSWLIRHETDPRWVATPDGLSWDHRTIGEYKTTSAPRKSAPRDHRDQMQWQMWCTGAELCWYAWITRIDTIWGSVAKELTPNMLPYERDDKRIAELVQVAERLIEETEALNVLRITG